MSAPFFESGLLGEGGALFIGLFIGIGFGWFLERSGMGSAPKLAGQFYLTDLTVFKVMFSAIVTAMLGVFWLGWLGVVDVSKIYVPETYLLPQSVGGLLFGIGFAMAGLCPGTSCVSAATGRVDGLLVMLGMFAGVFGTATFFGSIESFYNSSPRGTLLVPDILGISYGVAVFGVVIIALTGFAGAGALERRSASRA
ncbi:MAG TPA: YeeE/YedE thiosulfate transporter family protein [Gemmatimonadaceae bacterium]|nr:YeeE/YedE thiosulfate transporter family protein [Gemmatimonadaceae bacterium]